MVKKTAPFGAPGSPWAGGNVPPYPFLPPPMVRHYPPRRGRGTKAWLVVGGVFLLILALIAGLLAVGFGARFLRYYRLRHSAAYEVAAEHMGSHEFLLYWYGEGYTFTLVGGSIDKETKDGVTTGEAALRFRVWGDAYLVCLTLADGVWTIDEARTTVPALVNEHNHF
ncbi:MAG: hypothetical protein WDA00_07855 [Eubacteriales bacterium]